MGILLNKANKEQSSTGRPLMRSYGRQRSPKISIAFEPDLFSRIADEAEAKGVTFGAVVRSVLRGVFRDGAA
jgi:hypothetical protein